MTETTSGVDIRLTNDITISVGVAAYLVDLIELTRKLLARQNGLPLPEPAPTIQRSLRECADLRATCANASAQPVFGQPALPSEPSLTAKDIAAELNITPSRARWICQHQRLGRKVGNQWQITREEFEMYKTTRIKGVA